MMQLQQFVSASLTQIMAGVAEASAAASKHGALVNPIPAGEGSHKLVTAGHDGRRVVERVEFDIAVTATEGTESQAGIGVVVASLGLGARGKSAAETSSISRLRFSVPVVFSPDSGSRAR